jgi:ankyrin repeat protein
MSSSLPLRANLEWLRKRAKDYLGELRVQRPEATLSDAQLTLAREYGFPSWRQLKAYVVQLRQELGKLSFARGDEPLAAPGDPDLARLFSAIHSGSVQQAVEILQERPILARSSGPDGQTPLHFAARFNDPTLGAWLIAYGADPEAKFGDSSHTVLSWSATCNSPEFARTLVRLGARPDLFAAAGLGLIDTVRASFDDSGNLRPGAARSGSTRFGVDGTRLPSPPTTAAEQVSDALSMASRNAQVDVVRFLLTKKPDLVFRGYLGATPLHWAYFGGSSEIIELLLSAGADPHARDEYLKCTPRAFGIAVAANWGFDFLIRKLLAGDSSLAQPIDAHTSPLHEAARGGHVRVIQILFDHQADANFRNSAGKTPREVASDAGHTAATELLASRQTRQTSS